MKKLKSSYGFTLIEILAAVVIIAALCAIAIPAIVRANDSLSRQQANDYALSIYLAAQDELADKRTDGSIEKLKGTYTSAYDASGAEVYAMLESVSNDETNLAAQLEAIDTEKQYVFVSSDDRGELAEILPVDSIDESIFGIKPTVTIVFNEITGDVLYVRYAAGDIYGEYDGGIVTLVSEEIDDIRPVVQIVNGETCYVRIYTPPQSCDINNMTYTIKVEQLGNKENYYKYTFDGDTLSNSGDGKTDYKFKINRTTGVAKYVLDSLNPENGSFADKANAISGERGGSAIPAGSDVKVTVLCTYYDSPADKGSNKGKALDAVSTTGNPLFSEIKDGTVYISNGRNLQNLNAVSDTVAKDISSVKISDRVEAIEWSSTADYYYDKIPAKYTANDILRFVPITLNNFNNKSVSFDGNNKAINDLYVRTEGDAGLFLNQKGEVKNLTLNDPCIHSEKGSAGAIAAASSGTIQDCKVLINNTYDAKDQSENGEMDYNPDALVNGKENVGLLVGKAVSGTIKGCEVKVEEMPASGQNFGLLAGSCKNTNVSSQTVEGSVKGGKANIIGGAIGLTDGGTFSGITAKVNISDVADVYKETQKVDGFTPNDFGKAACPSGVGYEGMLVGFVKDGSFSKCSAVGEASALQFAGVVKCERKTFTNTIYKSATKLTSTVNADKTTDGSGSYKQTGGNAIFQLAEKYISYNNISLTDCTYKAKATGTTYKQEILPDNYYYTKGETEGGDQYRFKEITGEYDYNDPTPFIILDDTAEYALALNADYNPPATLYTVNTNGLKMLDYFPKNSYTKDTSSTTPIYFFKNKEEKQTYEQHYIKDANGKTVSGLVYEKDNHWPLYKAVLRDDKYNVFSTYFVLNDKATTAPAGYDHVVYDIGSYAFDFGTKVLNKVKIYNVMDFYSTQGTSRASYWSGQTVGGDTYRVKQAYVYTDTVKFTLSAQKVALVEGETGTEAFIRDVDLENCMWQNASLTEAGFNKAEKYTSIGDVLLKNYKYPSLNRTLSGTTKDAPIFLTIADDKQYAASRGAYMTPKLINGDADYDWGIEANVRSLTITNHSENGENYTTIGRYWENATKNTDNPFFLGMLGDTLYTKHKKDMTTEELSKFSHLHLYALVGNGTEKYNITAFTPTDTPAQMITSTKLS